MYKIYTIRSPRAIKCFVCRKRDANFTIDAIIYIYFTLFAYLFKFRPTSIYVELRKTLSQFSIPRVVTSIDRVDLRTDDAIYYYIIAKTDFFRIFFPRNVFFFSLFFFFSNFPSTNFDASIRLSCKDSKMIVKRFCSHLDSKKWIERSRINLLHSLRTFQFGYASVCSCYIIF